MLQRYLRTALLFQLSCKSCSAFSLAPSPSTVISKPIQASSTSCTTFTHNKVRSSFIRPLHAGSDDDDDFYSDYDPTQFESLNKPSTSYDDNYSFQPRSGGGDRFGGRGGGGRGRGGGSRGGNFVYTRDTSRDSSNVDEGAIVDLLNQRSEAKRGRDFDTADAIRDDLLQNFSVGVDDREKSWRTGCSTSGSGSRFGGGGRGGRGGRGGGRSRDFGPNGHDYEEVARSGENTSSLSVDEIHSMLAERLQAKMSRNFQVADSIQLDLINSGVYVHDGQKEWRADGVPFGDMGGGGRGPGMTGGSRNDRNRPYERSMNSEEVDEDNEALIEKLVLERSKLKLQRNYEKADSVREGLRSKFNVIIDDRLREWSVGGSFGEEHDRQRDMAMQLANRDYAKSISSSPEENEGDEETIQSLVNERASFKADRNYDRADAIREDLYDRFEVVINDKMKEWSIGGAFGNSSRNKDYEKSPGSAEVHEDDEITIVNMLKERSRCKQKRDFDRADAIRDELREAFNVAVDDREKEWWAEGPAPSRENRSSASNDNDEVDDAFEKVMDQFESDLVSKDSTQDENESEEVEDKTDDDDDEYEYEYEEVEVEYEEDEELEKVEVEEETDDADDNDESNIDLSSLTVPQLKERLRASGLPVSGKKAELIERLTAV